MPFTIKLNADCFNCLDLSAVEIAVESWLQSNKVIDRETQLRFEIDYPRSADDPREVSEIPEIRLWFLRLDARYPWLPLLLDWEGGELARYAAMLVPHQFSRTEGIQYNPEALEIFVMRKLFVLGDWLRQQGLATQSRSRLKFMAQMLGYELDEEFFDLIL